MTKTSTKLRKAFKKLGIELIKRNTNLYKFKFGCIYMLLSVDEELKRYAIIMPTLDIDDSPNKLMFDAIIESLEKTFESYSGHWNDGLSFVASPHYSIVDVDESNADWLWKQLVGAVYAFTFVEGWIYVFSDPAHLQAMGFPEFAEKLSEFNKASERPANII